MPLDKQLYAEELHLVRVDRLELGWVVDADIYADATVLLKAGTEITTDVMRGIRRRGLSHVMVKPNCELVVGTPGQNPRTTVAELLEHREEVYSQHGIETAIPAEVLELATDEIEELFAELEQGKPAELQRVRPVVELLIQQFMARPHLAIKLMDLDRFDRYTYRHSLNVGLLFLAIAQDWFTDEGQLIDAVFGAILHDVGKSRIDRALVNKPGALSDEERAIMWQHPAIGRDLLEEAGASPEVISIAYSHHERLDGLGYPERLRGDQIDQFARLVAICDVYDAVTTNRSYKQKRDFALAIDILVQGCGKHFDPVIANQFIRTVGRYPVGTFVRLSTDEIAVVRRVNAHAISLPVVSRVVDVAGNGLSQPEELDLCLEHEVYIASLLTSSTRPN